MKSQGAADVGPAGLWMPPAARLLIRGVTAAVRLERRGMEELDRLEARGQRAVLAFFHGRQFLLAGALAGRRLTVMASLSRDGEMQARVMRGLGYEVVRGSASRSGARGLLGLLKNMERGYHPTFAVDGPKGPLHEVKPGAVYLAKKAGAPVIPMTSSARPARVFTRAWDRYLLPMPFSRGIVILGEPIHLDGDMSEGAVERDCRRLRRVLLDLTEEADAAVGW